MTEKSKLTANLNSFEGKYAIITGSTQGLGEATAQLFAERGAAGILVTGRNLERGRAVVSKLKSSGCQAHFVPSDLANLDACEQIVAMADQAFGQVDVLVNAAAVTDRGSIWDTSPELWDHIMAVNLRAPFFLMQGVLEIMKREGVEGSIVNITSISAYGGDAHLTPYAASKRALVTLTKNIVYLVMHHRIRVNALNLGWMNTPSEDLIQRKYHSEGKDWLLEAEAEQPFGRLIQPEEAARAIAYLASRESGLMTGSVVDFDQSVTGAGSTAKPPVSKSLT